VSTTKILNILEGAKIEANQARAIAESLEIALREQVEDLTRRLMTKHDGSEMMAEIIKWMFIFWVGQVIFTVGIMKFMR